MHPILQDVKTKLKIDVADPIHFAQTASARFDSDQGRREFTDSTIRSLYSDLFKMELPPAVTANPRKESSLQLRYTIMNVITMAIVDLPKAFENAVHQTAKLLTDQPYLLLEDGVVSEVVTAGGTTVRSRKSGYVKGTGKTGRTKGAKQAKAAALFAANKDKSRQELIALFMKELDMSKAGASTYVYNEQKKAGVTSNKKGKKAKTVEEKAAAEAAKAAAPVPVKKPKGRPKTKKA